MAFSDSPLFKFSTTKDTPPKHGAENKNVDQWIKKSLINSTFHNRLPLTSKAMQKGPKCNSFWQNLCHSKGKLLHCILSLIFFQLGIFWKPVMRWGVWVWSYRACFSLHVLLVYLPKGLRKNSSPLLNLLLGPPSPAIKTDTIKTNCCECNQLKNLFIYPPPPHSLEKIHNTSTNENIIFWRPERPISLRSSEG